MKKLIAVLLIAALLVPTVNLAVAEATDGFTYGNGIKFGMTKEEVQSIAGEPDDENDTILMFLENTVAGKDAIIGYIFDENAKLNKIFVQFSQKHTNDNDFITDFEAIDKALTSVYPAGDYTNQYLWKDDLFKDDEDNYGLAIASGQLMLGSHYQTDAVNIYHFLSGDNYAVTHSITYQPLDYVENVDASGL